MIYVPKDTILLELPLRFEGERLTVHEMIEESGAKWCYENGTVYEKNVIKTATTYIGAEPLPPMFHYSPFVRTALPVRQPKLSDLQWKRQNGLFEVVLSSGSAPTPEGMKPVGLPYGTKARLILLYLAHQIKTSPKDQNEISFGHCLTDFMKRLGLEATGGGYGSIKAVKEQAGRLARCRFEFKYPTKWSDEFQVSDCTFSGTQLWKVTQGRQWPESITISSDLRESVRKHSFAVDSVAISLLKRNAVAFDWYVFLTLRTRPRENFERSNFIPWISLTKQMGSYYRRIADFKRNTIRALKFVGAVYPKLALTVTHQGIILKAPSPRQFPARIIASPQYCLVPPKELLTPAQKELLTGENEEEDIGF